MRDMDHAPYSRGQHLDPETPQRPRLRTGPDTSSQLLALQRLERISAVQHPDLRHQATAMPAAGSSASSRAPGPRGYMPREYTGEARNDHTSRSRRDEILRQHGARFASFSVIGGGIFVAGLVLQAALTSGLHMASLISYIIQGIASVEASYVLNRAVTWKATRTPFWGSFLRFNLQKMVTLAANLIMYAGLLKLGVNYLVANILLTVVFTFINYIGADRFVFLRGGQQLVAAVTVPLPIITRPMPVIRVDRQASPRQRRVRRDMPAVSVVIPVRANEHTILDTVHAILGQDYPMLQELILVGSPNDSTWVSLGAITDRRLYVIETETPPGIRDANFKRDLGIRRSSGELVSLIDSDMVIPPDWMSTAVRLLIENELDCVAGVMRSIRDDFWGRFVDGNRLSAKTPRTEASYLVTADGFGVAGYKPPITADILFTRKMYERCPIDSYWTHGSLEDYEWFWRVVESGHRVVVSSKLFGWHHHRAGMRKLSAEYRRSARGCVYFIRHHRGCPFAQKRVRQATAIPLIAVAILCGMVIAALNGYGIQAGTSIATLSLLAIIALCGREFARTRTMESLLYPVPAFILGANYTGSLIFQLIRSWGSAPVNPRYHDRATAATGSTGNRLKALAVFAVVVTIATGLRLWHLGSFPAWQWDEAVYWRVSENLQHGALTEHALYGVPPEPFLYQPPIFLEIESRWFDLFGASIYHARILGVACTAVMQVLLFRLLCRLHGSRIAIWAIVPVLFDGWLLYIERASYIENALMILVVLGFLLYKNALDVPSSSNFLKAGLALGAAASFKQTGAYVVVAALLCWLIVRRNHREHLVLLAGAMAVIAAYLAVMMWKYDPWFIDQSIVQVRRVLGLQQSGGTLTSPSGALHLLTQQYKYFVPSLLVAGCGFLIALRRTWQCVKARTWEPVRQNAVLYSWLVTGAVVFGSSSLKFPQYFVLILLPAYCYLWTEVAYWDLRRAWQRFWPLAAVTAGLGSFVLSVPAFSVNSLAEVQAYAAAKIPSNSIVVTERSIGDLIQQRWCSVEEADACVGHATYAITWQTYLQSSFTQGDTSFHKVMVGATSIASFEGSIGTATVWKLQLRERP